MQGYTGPGTTHGLIIMQVCHKQADQSWQVTSAAAIARAAGSRFSGNIRHIYIVNYFKLCVLQQQQVIGRVVNFTSGNTRGISHSATVPIYVLGNG